ncbi:hypothetical protein H2201_002814 [Coniosporium apollinis]|uniref:Alpha-galactosidase A n=2 Tax=Coniosporium TaxID=2810619 RepID=A0ABQ9P103_9PEZI|nr:hypothetical protein H2199_006565 [Cladosporium sp. JES 115]KAJ9666981.1 hypothetical protein H2201_002814 [Coniosporium apollinis]
MLNAEIDSEEESYYRFLVDDQHVKYVTIDAKLYPCDDMGFAPALILQLPAFPAGDWNVGHISLNPQTGHPYFAGTTRNQLPGVEHIWHATCIDYLKLTLREKIRSNVCEATCPQLDGTVVAKFARFHWEISYLDAETTAYEWIQGQGIGPKFLGHLTEEGRVIGFLMERVVEGRCAGPEELEECREVLGRLHQLGIRHGDVDKHSFLVHEGRALVIDFEAARKCEDPEALEKEMGSLEGPLGDTSGRRGILSVDEPTESVEV